MSRPARDLSRYGRFADMLDAGWVTREMALDSLGVNGHELAHLIAEGRVRYRKAGRLRLYKVCAR